VLFLLDEQTYALQIEEVERIVRAVEIRPLPESPSYVPGIVNIHGRVLPVVDLRLRFGQPTRDLHIEDHFIIARTPTVSAVLPVDAALGSLRVSGGFTPSDDEARARCLRKVVPLDGDVIYVLDLERVASTDECASGFDFASVLADSQTA